MTHVSITVDDEHLATIGRVADELRARGLEVDEVLDELGIITGSVPQERRRTLESVDGVAAVVPEQWHHLPPPDAPIQ